MATSSEELTLIERLMATSPRNKFLIVIFTIFGIAAGIHALQRTPLDAIPDLSDVQVIVYTDWEGRSPDLVEDQITYPISARFIAAPKVKFVRGESMFGKSFVYVIFEDGTDIYWARSRVIEYLSAVRGMLPEGVNPTERCILAPDIRRGVAEFDGKGEVSSAGEFHPHALAEPDVSFAAHPAPAVEATLRTPICQWANRPGSRREMRVIQCVARRRCRVSFLYFLHAHFASERSSCLNTG
jgi:hypothetical protein